jgi:hypothetical protein
VWMWDAWAALADVDEGVTVRAGVRGQVVT